MATSSKTWVEKPLVIATFLVLLEGAELGKLKNQVWPSPFVGSSLAVFFLGGPGLNI